MKSSKIVIVGENKDLSHSIKRQLLLDGYAAIKLSGKLQAPQVFENKRTDLIIICSFGNKTDDDLETVLQVRQVDKSIPIILITEYSSEDRVIAALKAGINDYFKKAFSYDKLLASIRLNLANVPSRPALNLKRNENLRYRSQPMIGESKPMLQAKAYLAKVAKTDSTTLITGETGTGKELAAEMIHQKSSRYAKPFICVNCAALPENLVESELFGYDRGAFTGATATKPGKFVLASGGSVFLDEIGDMSPFAQAKILSSIERKEVYPLGGKKAIPLDVRIIAATNQNPERLIQEGKFRQDLYYRINVARVHMPPLRERKADILQLIAHAIDKMNSRFRRNVRGLTDEAKVILLRHDWPGNVRELMNLLEAAFINLPSQKITFLDLPKQLKQQLTLSQRVPQDERRLLVSALLETKWNKSKAAQKLCWSRTTIYRKISQYNVVEKRNPDR